MIIALFVIKRGLLGWDMQKHIEKWGEKNMSGKISNFLREYVFIFSIVLTIAGFIILILSLSHYLFNDFGLDFIKNLEDWNFYIIIFGFIVLAVGVYYLYSFLINKKFLMDEIKTNKRSEFIKLHAELKSKTKHLPSKYRKILKDKEKELKIK